MKWNIFTHVTPEGKSRPRSDEERDMTIAEEIKRADVPSPKRTFGTGATRGTEEGKYDYEAFLSPLVLERYAEYLHKHRKMADGSIRDGDNWQKGIPLSVYMKSAWRHFHFWWSLYRAASPKTPVNTFVMEEALCAVMFNVMGFLHEFLKARYAVEADETEKNH